MGLFGDKVMTATLPGDSWRWRHDNLKVLADIATNSKTQIDIKLKKIKLRQNFTI